AARCGRAADRRPRPPHRARRELAAPAMAWHAWRLCVPIAERHESAAREIARFRGTGRPIAPVTIEGRAIARSFWGKAWCDNLQRYTRLGNRRPRRRTLVRNGAVLVL